MSQATELWQLYDEQGRPITGKGEVKDIVYRNALLHAASHVWLWRKTNDAVEILLQKRSNKPTWPGRYDISAAGHVDVGEDPITAALREIREEIGLECQAQDLLFIGSQRVNVAMPDNVRFENEIRFLFLLQAPNDAAFSLADGEVDTLTWKPLAQLKTEVAADLAGEIYVPHDEAYFGLLYNALETLTA